MRTEARNANKRRRRGWKRGDLGNTPVLALSRQTVKQAFCPIQAERNPEKLPPFIATPYCLEKWQLMGTQETWSQNKKKEKPPYLRGFFRLQAGRGAGI